ncbi:MAG: heme-copper oxidase subunit III [Chloroflexi bacterium]|nr:heme-copper oxidase subunit III [Chloroflexota bacterium]
MENSTPSNHSVGSLGVDSKKLGMWTFMGSEVMLFASLIATYLTFRGKDTVNPPFAHELLNHPDSAFIVAVNTLVLLCSSLTMVLALDGAERGNRRKFFTFILATAALGSLFLGVQINEYAGLIREGLSLSANQFGASFFVLTGFHGMHVAIGVFLLLYAAFRGKVQGFTREFPLAVEIIGLYWHFVDLVWVVIFMIVYLLK